MADDVTLEQALGPKDQTKASTPKKGEVSLDKVLGPDKSPWLKREAREGLAAIKNEFTPKTLEARHMDTWTHGIYSTLWDLTQRGIALEDGDQDTIKHLDQLKKEKQVAKKIQDGFKPEKGVGDQIKEIPGDLKELGKQAKGHLAQTAVVAASIIIHDAPTMALGGVFGIPGKVAKVLKALNAGEKTVAAGKAAGAVVEGAAVGATGEAAKEYSQEGGVNAGGVAKSAAQMAALDVGARALGLLYKGRKKGPKEEPTEEVNPPGGDVSPKGPKGPRKPEAVFAGKGERTPWPPTPTEHENIQARRLFQNDHEYAGYLALEHDQRAEKAAKPAMDQAAQDAHTAAKDVQAEVNGKKPVEDVPFREVEGILSKEARTRTAGERAALKKWQIQGMLGMGGGAGLAYLMADEDTKKKMAGAGIAMAMPFVLKDFHSAEKIHKETIASLDHKYGKNWQNSDLTPSELKVWQDSQKKYSEATVAKMYSDAKQGEPSTALALPGQRPPPGWKIQVTAQGDWAASHEKTGQVVEGYTSKSALVGALRAQDNPNPDDVHPMAAFTSDRDVFRDDRRSQSEGMPAVEKMTKVSGQKGSNPGGVYMDGQGTQWYVKKLQSPEHAASEVIASKLYELAGVPVVKMEKSPYPSTIGSKMMDVHAAGNHAIYDGVNENFVVDAWLGNWDVAGVGGENMMIHTTKNGEELTRMDVGGALLFRAQGAPKGNKFGPKVGEIQTMRDPSINPDAAKAFKNVGPSAMLAGAKKVLSVTPEQIHDAVWNTKGLSAKEKDELENTLLARQKDIADQFPMAAKSAQDDQTINSVVKAFKVAADKKTSQDHPHVDDNGKRVVIKNPSRQSAMSTWHDAGEVATFVPDGDVPRILKGVKVAPWKEAKNFTNKDWNQYSKDYGIPAALVGPLKSIPGKKTAAGAIIIEPDGRVWMVSPTNKFGGHENTFPKGGKEDGYLLQATAMKEVWEETGLQIAIDDHLGDIERETSHTRYYLAHRTGGSPSKMGWESQAVHLAPLDKMVDMLTHRGDLQLAMKILNHPAVVAANSGSTITQQLDRVKAKTIDPADIPGAGKRTSTGGGSPPVKPPGKKIAGLAGEAQPPAGGPVVSYGAMPPKPSDNPQIHTQAFLQWWHGKGRPALTNEVEVPLVYYHMTPFPVEEFDPKFSKYGDVAAFLAPRPGNAASLAIRHEGELVEKPHMTWTPEQLKEFDSKAIEKMADDFQKSRLEVIKEYPIEKLRKMHVWKEIAKGGGVPQNKHPIAIFARVTKPFDFENPEHIKDLRKYMADKGKNFDDTITHGSWKGLQHVQKELKKLGYDAYFEREGGGKNLAVFDPKDLKHATENKGTYLENSKIRGNAQVEFMLLLAGATGGFLLGSQMDKDHSIRDELIGIALGTLAGRIAGKAIEDVKPGALGRAAREAADSMAPGKAKAAATRMAEKVPGGEKSSTKPERIRIKEAIENHQTRIARAAREIMQVQTKLMELVPDAKRREVITRALDGENVMLTKTEKQMYEELKTAFKNIGDEAVRVGVLDELRENYVTHLVKRGQEDKLKKFLGSLRGPNMSPNSPYANPRKFPSIKDLEAAGIELVSKDAAHIYATYGYAMTRTIANKELIQGLINDSRGIFLPAGAKAPPEYRTVDRPLILGMKVHPDIVPELSFLFDTREPDAWVKAASALSTGLKRAEVSFSLFHAVALTQAFVASQSKLSHGLAGAVVGAGVAASSGRDSYTGALAGFAATMLAPAAYKAVQFSRGKDALLKQLREGGVGDEVDKALRDGLRISMEKNRPVVGDVAQDFYSGMESLQGLADKFVHPVAGQAIGKINALNHAIDNWMWGRLHAGMKLNVYMDKKSKLLRDNAKARDRTPETPLLSEERAGEIAASYANSLFGGLNWARLMEGVDSKFGRQVASALTSPTGMRYANFLTFAPDWTISTTGSALRAADLRPSQQELAGLHRQYVVRAALWTLAATEAITYSQTGQHIWEYPEEEWTVAHLGDGSTMQVSKHATEPLQWIIKGRQEALNKVGAVPSEIIEQATGDKYLSTKGAPKMKGVGERLAHLGKRILPFSGQQVAEGNAVGAISGTLGVPVYPPKKKGGKKKKAQDYLDEAVE